MDWSSKEKWVCVISLWIIKRDLRLAFYKNVSRYTTQVWGNKIERFDLSTSCQRWNSGWNSGFPWVPGTSLVPHGSTVCLSWQKTQTVAYQRGGEGGFKSPPPEGVNICITTCNYFHLDGTAIGVILVIPSPSIHSWVNKFHQSLKIILVLET